MRVAKIFTTPNLLETVVRKGFSGKECWFVQRPEGLFFVFMSYGQEREKIPAQMSAHYVIGPNWVKEVPNPAADDYYPRRWGFIHNVAHTSYFKLMAPGEMMELPTIYGNDNEPYTVGKPEKLNIITVKPLHGYPFKKCLVNKNWLTKASWEEFCQEMENQENQEMYG